MQYPHYLSHIIRRLLRWTYLLTIIATPFIFTWVNEELFEFPKMLLVYAAAVVVMGLWLAWMLVERRIIYRSSKFDWLVLAWLGSQILSTVFSIHPHTSIMGYYSRFHGGLLSSLAYSVLFFVFPLVWNRKNISQLLVAIVGAGLGVGLYAFPEQHGFSPSCVLISGNWGVSCWVQDVQTRIFGTFGQPNWLAAYMIMLLPLGWYLSFKDSFKTKRGLVWLGASLLFLNVLLATRSRSGFIGAGVTMMLFGGLSGLSLYFSQSLKDFLTTTKLELTNLVVGSILVLAITGTPYTPSLSQLLAPEQFAVPVEDISELTASPESQPVVVNRLETGGSNSSEIRKIVWQGAVDVWQRYPLLGSGLETFAYSYYQDRPVAHNLVSEWDFLYNKAHNELLNILANSGVVGLATYLALLGGPILFGLKEIIVTYKSKKRPATPQDTITNQILPSALVSGLVGLSISNFFGFSTVMVSVLMFFWLAILTLPTRKQLYPKKLPTYLKPITQIQLAGLSVLVLILLAMIWRWWLADYHYAQGKGYAQVGLANQAFSHLQNAVRIAPNEAQFYDQLSNLYAQLAVHQAVQLQNESTPSADAVQQVAELAQQAVDLSETMYRLNPAHINFYKSRTRTALTLAAIDPSQLEYAKTILLQGIQKAPSDAKLYYNLAYVESLLGNTEDAIAIYQETLRLKPNYEAARIQLAETYASVGENELAIEQYRYILENLSPGNTMSLKAIEQLEATQSAKTN